MRPSIHGDCLDVARRIEAPGAQSTGKLVTDFPLERLKSCGQQFVSADFVLLPGWQAGLAGSPTEMQSDWLFGVRGTSILTHVNCGVEAHVGPVGTRRRDALNA